MRRTGFRLLALVAAGVLAFAACGGDDDDSSSNADQTTTSAPASNNAAADVSFASTSLGDVLVDADGKTLYLFDNDEAGTSNCNEGCDSAWPPLTITGTEPAIKDGLDEEDFGTIERTDGTTQVTVYGLPLYRFGGDAAAGDTKGQGVGDIWWAAGKDGKKIAATSAGSSTDSSTPDSVDDNGGDNSGSGSGSGY